MTMRASILHKLETIRHEPVPEPNPQFFDELERRLLDAVADGPQLAVVEPAGESRSRWPRRSMTLVTAVAAAVVVLLGIVFATVQDATTHVATPAGPDQPAQPSDSHAAERETTPAKDDRGDPTDRPPYGDEASRLSDDAGSESHGSTEDDATTDRHATAEAPPGGARYGQPSETTFALEAEPTTTGADLVWERYDGDDFFAYVVLRATGGEDPTYPRPDDTNSTTEFVHRSESRDGTTWSDTNVAVFGEVRYLVVVFDRNGQELARSNVAAVRYSFGLNVNLPLGT